MYLTNHVLFSKTGVGYRIKKCFFLKSFCYPREQALQAPVNCSCVQNDIPDYSAPRHHLNGPPHPRAVRDPSCFLHSSEFITVSVVFNLGYTALDYCKYILVRGLYTC